MTIDPATLPPADAEQQHLVDEIEHADDFDRFQHGDFPRCCGEHSQAATARGCAMPDEAGR
jgi:hypothetical protein